MSTFHAFCAVILLAAVSRQSAICADLDEPQNSGIRFVSTFQESALAPPPGDGPVKVRAALDLLDIHEIDEEKETFEFTGILTLKWMDQRQAFIPAQAGVQTKVYQSALQCNELSPAWYPQVVLANASGPVVSSAVALLVESGGNCTLIQTINANAEVQLNLRRTPFDSQRLEVVIVMLSWSVFWMNGSSLGDRMSVSFVGILTAVTYQIVLGDMMPQISYLT